MTRIRRFQILSTFVAVVVIFGPFNPSAEEIDFLGERIEGAPGRYLVKADVNIRAKPRTNSERLGSLDEGAVVDIAGQVTNTTWFGLLRDGQPAGFVYGPVLQPVLDGAIEDDVTGEFQVDEGHRCGYRVQFIGNTGLDGDGIRTSDYDASIVCERDKLRIRFPAQMFITEVTYNGSAQRRIFQINVDLLDGVHALDDVFSTILLFDLDNRMVRLDALTEPTYAREEGGDTEKSAANVSMALAAALEIALSQWSQTAWADIYTNAKG